LNTNWYGAGVDFLSYVPATEEIAPADCGLCKNSAALIPVASSIRKPVDHNTRDLRSRSTQPAIPITPGLEEPMMTSIQSLTSRTLCLGFVVLALTFSSAVDVSTDLNG
jgi:hypothetical protein